MDLIFFLNFRELFVTPMMFRFLLAVSEVVSPGGVLHSSSQTYVSDAASMLFYQ